MEALWVQVFGSGWLEEKSQQEERESWSVFWFFLLFFFSNLDVIQRKKVWIPPRSWLDYTKKKKKTPTKEITDVLYQRFLLCNHDQVWEIWSKFQDVWRFLFFFFSTTLMDELLSSTRSIASVTLNVSCRLFIRIFRCLRKQKHSSETVRGGKVHQIYRTNQSVVIREVFLL